MEIINERAALLSNYEVYNYIKQGVQSRKGRNKPSDTPNLATVELELKMYLESTPCNTQSEDQVKQTLTSLLDYSLTKFEKLQLLNLRPRSLVELHVLLEECEERFEEDKLIEILKLLRETLPRTDDPPLEELEAEEEPEETDVNGAAE
ncbi:hypothetical protein DSO57_1027985 [Entomophthora muscae]|uniref:Uncharacterized protein n=1 Tax=Entomophthora muscae TaxID=34485 RepID=A0ACC2S3M7_9FUNG|nr:hypothetical protein DSO57_1027985 [Entomophthora muscae]